MKSIKIVFAIFFSSIIIAQEITITNQSTFGGGQVDFGMKSFLNTDGSVIISGRSLSGISGDKTLASYGSSDVWLLKLNSDFSLAWQIVLGGNDAESNPVVLATNDGGYLVGVSSVSPISGNKSVASFGLSDVWLIKIDGNGVIQWQYSYGGTLEESIESIQELSNGDFILGCTSDSPISGNKSENSQGSRDYWIVKIDSDGMLIWDKTFGGSASDVIVDMKLDNDFNIILSGHSFSNISGNKTENSYGSRDYWVVKVNQFGSILWDKTLGGDLADEYPYLGVTENFYYISGYSDSDISGIKTENSNGAQDIWTLKLDYAGNIIWDRTIGGSGVDGPSSIVVTQDDQLLIAANSMSDASGDKTENMYNGSQDFWLVSLDTNGNFLWDKTIGGNGLDAVHSLHEKADNNYILFGYSDSNISGDKDEVCRGAEDYWIVEVSSNVGIGEQNSHQITLFPNPTSEGFRLNQAVNSLTIVTLDGRVISVIEKYNGEFISTENFVGGIYFVQFEVDGIYYSKKVVVR
ncbi:MAG: T9SS type A sorting domain-containing protein [Crocinitomicaceae bacterium]|nr:T9SS type A sorting domain-containing protein [Crocinitomicaceae bacterium]